MIRSTPSRRHDRGDATEAGWLFSLLLHSVFIVGSLLFVQRLTLPPPSELFTWNVAIVSKQAMTPTISPPILPSSSLPPAATPSRLPAGKTLPPFEEVMTLAPSATPSIKLDNRPALYSRDAAGILHPEAGGRQTENVDNSQESSVFLSTSKPMAESSAAATAAISPQIESSEPAPEQEPLGIHAPQTAALVPTATATAARPDYGWLSEMIVRRVEELKRYPLDARIEQAQGKVLLRLVIKEDGTVGETEVIKSSGFHSLDQAALDLIRRAAPFSLTRPLGSPSMTVRIPFSYSLDQR